MSESPIITFVRSVTLLAVLIALPGIAVCWNHLPKDLWSKSAPSPTTLKVEKTQAFRNDSGESARHVSVFAPESVFLALPEPSVVSEMQGEPQAVNASIVPPVASHYTAIQQVSWEHSSAELPRNFETQGLRLESLGATYYKIEKWGNRGELFRVSCFVPLSDNHSHTKHFQAIGSDVVTVMQTVITDIERWRNLR